ncbi:selenoneine synthase SenA [Caenimonas aquaedulcis]|uniref:Ergothioneine biosynthesis protein EgtB n=1 Tax=Caenimonas aquaedulcis TaxID=2793270 RepID=A0A931H6W6_9BURK|nr:selenoneine synthase SenA [Caenimonas aquaedulcis]MBG9389542.1 ergothioneine biosynthesis protein EgtB [Caenimonas aquaedulcis]
MERAFPPYTVDRPPAPSYAFRSGGRDIVRQGLVAARERTLALAEAYAQSLGPACSIAYSQTVNPPLWELGHIGWFQECWIGRNRQRASGVAADPEHERAAPLMPGADALYDSSRVAHATRWTLPLPDAAGTRAYLAATLEQSLGLLDALPQEPGDAELYFFRLVALHEEMHAEAATYMARALGVPLPPLRPAALPAHTAAIRIPAQTFTLGHASPGFAFDNELQPHEVYLDAYEIDAQPVSWARYQGFVDAGGYSERRWWGDEGWAWLEEARPSVPRDAGPAGACATHLSAYEAQAWCRWAGRRLPTEAEWECAAIHASAFAWGQVWEWTSNAFEPYPGFVPHPYRDYSAPWFGTRRVLRGACAATSPIVAHPRYRNFFEPHRRDIFAGFRSCAP